MNQESSDNSGLHRDDQETGLPILRSWRAVYAFVVVCFACWVAILALLPRVFA